MTYTCDTCGVDLQPGYAPQVDHRGRPCLAICESCNSEMVSARARRLGLTAEDKGDLFDQLERHLSDIGFVQSPADGWKAPR